MSLYLISRFSKKKLAEDTARQMEYFGNTARSEYDRV
jgi:hypothetical protein